METLNPVQRVAVIAIGLALTLLVAMFILPWAWKQLSEWLPAAVPGSIGHVPTFWREFVTMVVGAPWTTVPTRLFVLFG